MKINENQKVTLTVGQLKKLVNEGAEVKPVDRKSAIRGKRMYRDINEAQKQMSELLERIALDNLADYNLRGTLFADDEKALKKLEKLQEKYFELYGLLNEIQWEIASKLGMETD